MRNVSHKTPIRSLLEHLDAWRDEKGWGRDKLAAVIVDAYESGDGPMRYRVHFEKNGSDAFKRAHTLATRIFRWFQDDDKDTNLLSVNFLMPILAAMPRDLCISWLNGFLRPLGLGVRSLNEDVENRLNVQRELLAVMKEDAESQQAFARLLTDTSPEAIASALKEMNDSVEVKSRIQAILLTARAATPQT